MKLAIVGSREFLDYALLERRVWALIPAKNAISEIVSGGARGADTLAERFAKENNIPLKVFKPDWKLGNHAGLLRNQTIVEYCDSVIAFWDGQSRGTQDTIRKARIAGKPVTIVEYTNIEG